MDDKERLLATLKDIVSDVIDCAEYYDKTDDTDDGDLAQHHAFVEVLHIIQRNCAEEDRESIGIDFDISEKYGISSFNELL